MAKHKPRDNRSVIEECAEGKIKINHIIFVLDRSGSMEHVRKATLDSLNEQLQQMKIDSPSDQANLVTVLSFAKTIKVLRSAEPLSEIKPIEFDEYSPYGNTALFDAIGSAIGHVSSGFNKHINFDNAGLLFVLTDGVENASEEFKTKADIKKLIEAKKKDGRFTFTFMGCSQTLLDEAISFGFNPGSVTWYDHSATGLADAALSNSISTRSFFVARDEGKTTVEDFYCETPSNKNKDNE